MIKGHLQRRRRGSVPGTGMSWCGTTEPATAGSHDSLGLKNTHEGRDGYAALEEEH